MPIAEESQDKTVTLSLLSLSPLLASLPCSPQQSSAHRRLLQERLPLRPGSSPRKVAIRATECDARHRSHDDNFTGCYVSCSPVAVSLSVSLSCSLSYADFTPGQLFVESRLFPDRCRCRQACSVRAQKIGVSCAIRWSGSAQLRYNKDYPLFGPRRHKDLSIPLLRQCGDGSRDARASEGKSNSNASSVVLLFALALLFQRVVGGPPR